MQYTLVTEENFESLKDNIDTKASKKSLANTDRRLQAMYDLQNGRTWAMMTIEDTENPASAVDGSALATVNEWGGKSVVWNQVFGVSNMLVKTNNAEVEGYSYDPNTKITTLILNKNNDGYTDMAYNVFYLHINNVHAFANHKYYVNAGVIDNPSNLSVYADKIVNQSSINKRIFDTGDTLTSSAFVYIYPYNPNGLSTTISVRPYVVDLTVMFGKGKEPVSTDDTRIKWIESYVTTNPFYNAGELVSADVKEVESVGRNLLWLTRKGETFTQGGLTISISEDGTTVSVNGTATENVRLPFWGYDTYTSCTFPYESGSYTFSRNIIRGNYPGTAYFNATAMNNGQTKIIEKGSTNFRIQFTNGNTFNNCVVQYQLEKGENAREVSSYKSESFTLPTSVRTQYPLRSAGTVYDKIVYDGKKWWHIKRINVVNLSSCDFKTYDSSGVLLFAASSLNGLVDMKAVCNVYEHGSKYIAGKDKYFYFNASNTVFIDSSYNDIESFKASLVSRNAYVYHELPTPITTDITDLMQDWDGTLPTETGGTITFVCNDDTLWQVPNTIEYAVEYDGFVRSDEV